MKSDDQKFRDTMMREIRKVRPLFAAGVETDASIKSYHEDFHSRSIRQMQNYQDKHRVVFCKACKERQKYGRRIYRKLHISFEADLLGNIERVVHAECYKCGFDMLMPAEKEDYITSKVDEFEWNRVRGAFNELHLERDVPLDMIFNSLQRCAQEYEMRHNAQRDMTASEVQARMQPYQDRMNQMMRQQIDNTMMGSFGQVPMSNAPQGPRDNHSLDAMRYQMETLRGQAGALSSAPTSQAKKRKKK